MRQFFAPESQIAPSSVGDPDLSSWFGHAARNVGVSDLFGEEKAAKFITGISVQSPSEQESKAFQIDRGEGDVAERDIVLLEMREIKQHHPIHILSRPV